MSQHKQPPPILSVYPVTEFLANKFIHLVPNMKVALLPPATIDEVSSLSVLFMW